MNTYPSLLADVRRFIHTHDDLPAFHAGYLVVSVIVAAMFNLGAFILLIAAHVSLDIVKYREYLGFSYAKTIEGVVRENLTDVMLISIALVFSVYLHHTMGLALISGVLRSDLVIIRMLGILIPKVEILQDFLTVMAHALTHLKFAHHRIGLALSSVEKLSFFVIISCIVLLFSVPVILPVSLSDYLIVLSRELIPWM